MLRKTILLALIISSIYFFLSSHLELTLYRYNLPGKAASAYILPSASTIQATSLNYKTAAADLLWINTILYTADHAARTRKPAEITDFADTLITLDPYFYPIYRWHSSARIAMNRHLTYEDVFEANRVSKVGMEHFSNDWQLPFSIAANHIGVRYERSPQEQIADLEEAYNHARIASKKPNAPDHLLLLATGLQRRLVRLRARHSEDPDSETLSQKLSPEELDFLFQSYFQAQDEARQDFLLYRLQELGVEAELLEKIDEYDRNFRKEHLRSAPYLSSDLFSLVENSLYTFQD